MAKKFLTQIDMNGLEIRNFVVHNLASDPTGTDGMLYYNTGSDTLRYYNGTSWVTLDQGTTIPKTSTTPKMDGTAAIGSETAYAAGDHIHPTDTSRAPTNHASSATTYGTGSSSNYGHVKLSDSTSSTSSTSSGVAATPKAVNDALDAAKSYADGIVSTADAMRFKGTLGTGGTITSLPSSNVKVGDTYRVITAGTYASIKCEVGDLVIATATTPTWTVAQTNIDGAVTASTTTTNNYLAKFTGDKIVANGPQLGSGTTTYLRNDGQWGTPVGTTYSNATTTTAGLMSADDKTKLSNLWNVTCVTGEIPSNTTSAVTINLTEPNSNKFVMGNNLISVMAYIGSITTGIEKVEIDWSLTADQTNKYSYLTVQKSTTGTPVYVQAFYRELP